MHVNWWVPFIFAVMSLSSQVMAGNKWIAAWYVLIPAQAFLGLYSYFTGQQGFWLLNAGSIIISVRNIRRWTAEKKEREYLRGLNLTGKVSLTQAATTEERK